MEGKHNAVSMSFDSEQARKEMEEKRAHSEENKLLLEQMHLAVGCEEMDRIVTYIIVPVFLVLVHKIREEDGRAEVVAFDAENPVYPGEMCEIGMKFRCGDRDEPCKIEFVADPYSHTFLIEIRTPNGDLYEDSWPYARVIPRHLEELIVNFMNTHFPKISYEPQIEDFDQYDINLEGPFKVEMEEECGKVTDLAHTETLEEAIKMGASLTNMFKGKPLTISDKNGKIVC